MKVSDFHQKLLDELRYCSSLDRLIYENLITQRINPGDEIPISEYNTLIRAKNVLLDNTRNGVLFNIKDNKYYVITDKKVIAKECLEPFDAFLWSEFDVIDKEIIQEIKDVYINKLIKPVDLSPLYAEDTNRLDLSSFPLLYDQEGSKELLNKGIAKIVLACELQKRQWRFYYENIYELLKGVLSGKYKEGKEVSEILCQHLTEDKSILLMTYSDFIFLIDGNHTEICLTADIQHNRLNVYNALFHLFSTQFNDPEAQKIFEDKIDCILYDK